MKGIFSIFESEGKYGVKENDAIVIPAIFDAIDSKESTLSNLTRVWKNGLIGFINAHGEQIIDCIYSDAKLLFDDVIAVEKDRKWGIFNASGEKIANFFYDNIYKLVDRIAVIRERKVGILNKNGTVFLDAIYDRVECVNISNPDGKYYNTPRTYSHTVVYNTENGVENILHATITAYGGQIHNHDLFDFSKNFIVKNENKYELFCPEEGFVKNSKFDYISPLTDLSYCVRKNDKYGVYRVDAKKLIIPCEYDQILFEGNHTVLLRKGELWGAHDLFLDSQKIHKMVWNVEIDTKFRSIKILNNQETLFSVEIEYKDYQDRICKRFSIINNKEEEPRVFSQGETYESHFELFDDEHIFTKCNGKYGFINLRNQNTIPFIYDEVEPRKDELFDVRIGDAWGVLNREGREVVPVRYNRKIKFAKYGGFLSDDTIYDDLLIVTDSRSKKEGIINKAFEEVLPCIYDHVMIDYDHKLIYYGYGGYELSGTYGANFFSGNIEDAEWGCMLLDGRVIIPAKYDCFVIDGDYIRAGRDGGFLLDNNYSCSAYGGVYDLYDKNGLLIFGGFDHYSFDEKRKLWFFQLGGSWKQDSYSDQDDYGNTFHCNEYEYIKDKSKWIVLDENMNSVIPRVDGTIDKLGAGFIHNIHTEDRDGKKVTIWQLPSFEMTSTSKPYFQHGALICTQNNCKFAVLIERRYRTRQYHDMRFYDDDKFLYCGNTEWGDDDYAVMIAQLETKEDGQIVENDNYLALEEAGEILTIPQNGYFFRVNSIDDDNCCVDLLQEGKHGREDEIVAISSCNKMTLSYLIVEGLLKIHFDEKGTSLENIILPHDDIFDKSFIELISKEKGELVKAKDCKKYWLENGDYELDLVRKDEMEEDSYGFGGGGYDDYERYDTLNDAFEGDVELYNDWLLN